MTRYVHLFQLCRQHIVKAALSLKPSDAAVSPTSTLIGLAVRRA